LLSDKPTIMDASSIINIAASGHAKEIMAIVSEQVFVCSYVREKECLYLRSVDADSVETIQLAEWQQAGILQDCELTALEEEQFLVYASQVDDGEAMSLAIARARGFTLITDDRKAQRLATADGIALLTSPQILHAWAAGQHPPIVSEVLRAVESRARYRPSEGDPLNPWWLSARDRIE
jgi:predicted nucleic acid-binding protein